MEQPHVVVFPYDEQGHITPALAAGLALARRGVRVTGVLTATRCALPTSSHLAHACPLFCIEAIPDLVDIGVGHQDDVCFHHSLQKLELGLEQLLLRMRPPPSCLISDILYPWSQDLADRLCLPRFIFCVFPAITFLVAFHFPTLCSKGLLPFQPGMEDEVIDFIKGLPEEFRLADVPVDFLKRDHKHLEVVSRVHRSMKRAAGIVFNTLYELEAHAMDALFEEGFSMYAIGPMGSMDWKENLSDMPSLFVEDKGCLRWLDNQPQGSVVYVAFGSIVSLTGEEIQEVAMGLEACGQPFLWVFRGSGASSMDPMSALPTGFQERTKEIGRVIGWAPQAAVLAHASVGCFLSHCGMGSLVEALWAGVPMIGGFSKLSDLNTTLRLATKEWGLGMVLQDRNVLPPQPLRCAIEMCVKEVIHGERGRALSQRALQLKSVIRKAVEPDGSSYLSLSKLVSELCMISNSSKS